MEATTTRTRQATPERWAAALDRAIGSALDVLVCGATGEAFVESASMPGLLYAVSATTCTCPAGEAGDPVCQHRAAYLAQCGELPLDPEPDRITFTGNSDRQEIQIDGRYFGFAAYGDDSGWTLYQGRGPHARRRGTFCTLDEIERYLTAMLPVSLPVRPAMRIVELARTAA